MRAGGQLPEKEPFYAWKENGASWSVSALEIPI